VLRRGDERLRIALSQLTRAWMRMAREEARELGLSVPQLMLLGTLREAGTVPVSRWADAIGSSLSAATGLLDRLESERYVTRGHGREDRRQVLISLTPRGRKLADRLSTEFQRRWSAYTVPIPSDQLEAAASVLERLVGRLDLAETEESFGEPRCDAESASRGPTAGLRGPKAAQRS
jgi:MarR family transcriptional regulator, organic hydroperoxide resistance regulator